MGYFAYHLHAISQPMTRDIYRESEMFLLRFDASLDAMRALKCATQHLLDWSGVDRRSNDALVGSMISAIWCSK